MPGALDAHLLPQGALSAEADLQVGPDSAGVELQDAQVDLVQLEVAEGVAEGQSEGLRAVAVVAVALTEPDGDLRRLVGDSAVPEGDQADGVIGAEIVSAGGGRSGGGGSGGRGR